MSEFKFRPAEPADAEAFTEWLNNPDIDAADKAAGTLVKNPTALYFVVEKDGKAVAFAPIYLQAVLPHLVLSPDAEPKDKLRALEMMIDGVSALLVQFGVRELLTMSKEEYPIAQWALKHHFELDPRQAFKLDLNKVMESVEV